MKKPSKGQRKVIDAVLRTLDAQNEYLLGDQLRIAFGVELDSLRTDHPGTAQDIKDSGFAKGGRYYNKKRLARYMRAVRAERG